MVIKEQLAKPRPDTSSNHELIISIHRYFIIYTFTGSLHTLSQAYTYTHVNVSTHYIKKYELRRPLHVQVPYIITIVQACWWKGPDWKPVSRQTMQLLLLNFASGRKYGRRNTILQTTRDCIWVYVCVSVIVVWLRVEPLMMMGQTWKVRYHIMLFTASPIS